MVTFQSGTHSRISLCALNSPAPLSLSAKLSLLPRQPRHCPESRPGLFSPEGMSELVKAPPICMLQGHSS